MLQYMAVSAPMFQGKGSGSGIVQGSTSSPGQVMSSLTRALASSASTSTLPVALAMTSRLAVPSMQTPALSYLRCGVRHVSLALGSAGCGGLLA